MAKRVWTTEQFQAWLSAAGLSSPQLAAVLDVSERTAKRLRSGEVGVKDAMTARAQEWLGQSRTTTGRDAELLDSYAAQADWADLCQAFPNAHVTGMQSAIARGWTSANSHGFRQLSQPERMPQPARWGDYDLEWIAGVDLPWGVEVREDTDGRPYRVASAERTLLELAVHEAWVGEDDVGECYRGAFHLAEKAPDRGLLIRKAMQRGAQVEDIVQMYIRNYAKI
ncbi:hypothetical protein [Agrobacterium genomosp. 2]|uniref:Uncharacterized protein n=1 Tax=Agrobacterium genomosp. 2 str. CFBP 5494 TaxID=1183436 RepID=A0A9W5F1E7_9HYPH|nr:hypothetical protein [Agrobacterium genomosp. 2]CUW87531.1 exported hypothetical protein [Agrobacterium genomosp. 2 str. CFBP 5494]